MGGQNIWAGIEQLLDSSKVWGNAAWLLLVLAALTFAAAIYTLPIIRRSQNRILITIPSSAASCLLLYMLGIWLIIPLKTEPSAAPTPPASVPAPAPEPRPSATPSRQARTLTNPIIHIEPEHGVQSAANAIRVSSPSR